jgi:hypothetical protein
VQVTLQTRAAELFDWNLDRNNLLEDVMLFLSSLEGNAEVARGPDRDCDFRIACNSSFTDNTINHKAYLDLWNRIIGMRQQIAYSQTTKPVQNTADDHKCALVCD